MQEQDILMQSPPKDTQDPSLMWAGVGALLLALLTNIFLYPGIFQQKGLGLGVPLFVLAGYAFLFVAGRKHISLIRGHNWVLLPFIFLLSAAFALFNNGFVLFLDGVGLILLVALQTGAMFGLAGENNRFSTMFHTIFAKPFCRIGKLYTSLFRQPRDGKGRVVTSVLLGVLLALVVCIPLVLLLAGGDMVFGKLMDDIFRIQNGWDVIGRLFLFALVFTLSGSTVIAFLTKAGVRERTPRPRARFNLVTVYVLLSIVALPLIVFSAIQLIFLTGSGQLPPGITYSEYARSGFFQLCFAALLTFGVTALCMAFTRHARGKEAAGLKALFSLLQAGVMMMLVSAFVRMVYYEQVFHFTRLRLYVQIFIILLAIVVVLVLLKIWIRKFRLASALVVAVAAGLCLLTYSGVDGIIGRYNGAHIEKDHDLKNLYAAEYMEPKEISDLDYLLSLSVDAFHGYAYRLTVEDFMCKEDPEDDWQYNDHMRWRQHRLLDLYEQCGKTQGLSWNAGRRVAHEFMNELDPIVRYCQRMEGK